MIVIQYSIDRVHVFTPKKRGGDSLRPR